VICVSDEGSQPRRRNMKPVRRQRGVVKEAVWRPEDAECRRYDAAALLWRQVEGTRRPQRTGQLFRWAPQWHESRAAWIGTERPAIFRRAYESRKWPAKLHWDRGRKRRANVHFRMLVFSERITIKPFPEADELPTRSGDRNAAKVAGLDANLGVRTLCVLVQDVLNAAGRVASAAADHDDVEWRAVLGDVA
jgi:hypothetical protein